MKKNRKIVKHFFAILYCLAMAIPLFSVVYYQIDGLGDYTKIQEDNSNGNNQYEDLPQTYYEKVQYQTNEVNSVDDLVVGNVYRIYAFNSIENWFWSDTIDPDYAIIELYDSKLLSINYNSGTFPYIEDVLFPLIYNKDNYYKSVYISFEENGFYVYEYETNDYNNYLYSFFTFDDYSEDSYIQVICSDSLIDSCNEYLSILGNDALSDFFDFFTSADLSECVPTYVEKTTEKKQYYFDDAFGKSYLDFAYGGSQSYSQYYLSIEGDTYQDAYTLFQVNTNDEYTQMLINYDFLNLMGVDGLYSNNHRGAWYLWLNFYINYLLNMAIIIFMPEVLMIFIQWCRDIAYGFLDKKEGF